MYTLSLLTPAAAAVTWAGLTCAAAAVVAWGTVTAAALQQRGACSGGSGDGLHLGHAQRDLGRLSVLVDLARPATKK